MELRPWQEGGGLWPYDKLCWAWSDEHHVRSIKHQRRLGHSTQQRQHLEDPPPPPPPPPLETLPMALEGGRPPAPARPLQPETPPPRLPPRLLPGAPRTMPITTVELAQMKILGVQRRLSPGPPWQELPARPPLAWTEELPRPRLLRDNPRDVARPALSPPRHPLGHGYHLNNCGGAALLVTAACGVATRHHSAQALA